MVWQGMVEMNLANPGDALESFARAPRSSIPTRVDAWVGIANAAMMMGQIRSGSGGAAARGPTQSRRARREAGRRTSAEPSTSEPYGALAWRLQRVCGAASCVPSVRRRRVAPTQAAPPWFEDIAERAGIRFVHRSGPPRQVLPAGDHGRRRRALRHGQRRRPRPVSRPERQPLSPADKPAGNRLYRNRGDGTFDDVTAGSGADVRGLRDGRRRRRLRQRRQTSTCYVTNSRRQHPAQGRRPRPLHRRHGQGRRRQLRLEHERRVSRLRRRRLARSLRRALSELAEVRRGRVLQPERRTPDYCSPRTYDLPSRVHALPQQRQRHVHRRVRSRRPARAQWATAWASSPATSTATAGSTCSSPTTARRITCG